MNFKDYLDSRQLYRITGTPENFLTAARYKLWGLNENNFKFYQTINPGDFIFFHSQRESQFFRNPASKIVGFGVVGNEFWVDDNKLWINSDTAGTNYPYRFSLSYVALFADISFDDTWDSTNFKFHSQTVAVLQNLLNSGFEPHKLFPKMGSFSQIKNSKAIEHLIDQTLLRETYYGYVEESGIDKFKSSPITEIRTENDVLRYSSPIVAIDQIKGHVFTRTGSSLYTKDTAKLRDANEIHQQILISLKKFFDDKQYELYNNNHMDMLAFNKDKSVSFLIEAKSLHQNNYIPQTRKGIIQLFEYNYFDLQNFKLNQNITTLRDFKVLATNTEIKNTDYVKFMNSIGIHAIAVDQKAIVNQYGAPISF